MHDFLSPERVERTIEQHLAIVEAAPRSATSTTTERRLDGHFAESLAVVEERAATRPRPDDRSAAPRIGTNPGASTTTRA